MIKQRIRNSVAEDEPSVREKRMWMIALGVGFALSVFFNLGPAQRPHSQQPANMVNESGLVTLPASTTVSANAVVVADKNRFN